MFRFHPFIYLAFLASAVAEEVRLTLETAPVHAMRHNSALIAARLRIDEARGRWQQSGRLANPELELGLDRNLRAPEGSAEVALIQKFPLTARLRLEKAVTHAELAAAEAEVRDLERKLRAEVGGAVVKFLALNGQKSLRLKQLENSRELADFTRRRVGSGEAASADAALIELETLQLQTDLLELDLERETLLGELHRLLGLPEESILVIEGDLPEFGPSRPAKFSLIARPDFLAAQHSADAARQNASLSRARQWEDLGIGLNLRQERSEDAPEGFQSETFAGVKFNLPLPLWNNHSGNIDEAMAAATRKQKEAGALGQAIQAEAATARKTMSLLARLIATQDEKLLPKAAEIETQLRASHARGEVPLPDVQRARERRLLIERQRLDALRDYHLARVRYLAAIGQ